MTIPEILNAYLLFLYTQWTQDMHLLSKPWIYWTIVPWVFCLAFVVLKTAVITMPLWLPVRLAFERTRIVKVRRKKRKVKAAYPTERSR